VIAVLDERAAETTFMDFPGRSRILPVFKDGTGVPLVPSLIHYKDDGAILIGEEVVAHDQVNSPATAQWMRQYISMNSPVQIPSAQGTLVSYREAGTAFLTTLLAASRGMQAWNGTGIVFGIPMNADEQYTDWIRNTAIAAGINTVHLIDEAAAAVLGYGQPLEPGAIFLIIELCEGSCAVKMVTRREQSLSPDSIHMQVLGAAEDAGSSTNIDFFIARDVLLRTRLGENDVRVRRVSARLLYESGLAREQLLAGTGTTVRVHDPVSGLVITAALSGSDLERILQESGFFVRLDMLIERACAAARVHGYQKDQIAAVLMTGTWSAIPCVQDAVRQRFGIKRVHCDHPVDAVARGAATYTPGAMVTDRINNDYAIRYWDPVAQEHRYRFLVQAGARYPSAGQVARFVISAAYDGQTQLGIPLFEITRERKDSHPGIELVSDANGGMRLAGPAPDALIKSRHSWVNEREPTFLYASPPAKKGEPRFELTFTVDEMRNLCVTARDMITGTLAKQDTPVFRLT
jgi:molecular chaperone DnaK (HSP70)